MKYCIANWKMNMGTKTEVNNYFVELQELTNKEGKAEDVMMVICPPYTLLDYIWNKVHQVDKNENFFVAYGVQNFHPDAAGA